ncbi:OmpA family protein [Bradyrhizobium sp. CCGB12]|uniref:OmpA family protein n=1 Tax=Bradyrhizobium sp. CCGB12 TaxID=2949632 RepID=UPI0020B3D20E|nr:OmpA family protein [Bradyrhizobium sp. CCGB12]MCP3393605.1 OmpA family protein [Bradyrhizobium sp. CCGB12]
MTNLRFVLLATTALTAMQFASSASHAQSAPPLVVAQAQPQETGPDGKPKQPPKGPPAATPPARPATPPPAAAPHPPAAPPPAAAPPRPAAPPPSPPPAARPAPPPPPPPPAAPKQPSQPPAAAPKQPAPPPAAAPQQHAPTPPAARPAPTPPAPPPAAAPQQHAPTPPTGARPSPTPPPPPAAGPAGRPAPAPTATPPAPTAAPAARPNAPAPATTPAPTATPTPAAPSPGRPGAPPPGGRPGAPPAAGSPSPAPGAAPTATPAPGAGTPTPPPGRPGAAPTPAPGAAPTATPTPGQQGATPPAGAPAAGAPAAPPQAGAPARPPAPPAGAAAPTVVPGTPAAAPPPNRAQYAPPTVAPAFRAAPRVAAPLPPPPRPQQRDLTPLAVGAGVVAGAVIGATIADLHSQRREVVEGGRTVYTEPDRIIIRDPGGQAYVRGNDLYRFRYGARDIRTDTVGGETRTVVVRPDGSEVITVVGADGSLLRRIRRDPRGRELVIIDNSYRDPRAVGGFYVDVPPPVVSIPYDRYIVDAQEASPQVIYDTMRAPPVQRIDRRYSLDEIRYSPNVRMQMPSIDVNTINFETGSWTIPPDQAARLQVIADGINQALQANPQEVFLIEGHTDAVGNDVDNLSLSDRRAQAAAELLTQQFNVPAENLTSQGYGEQYLKEQTTGPSLINRRVTVRRITPLLNGGQANAAPPPPRQ